MRIAHIQNDPCICTQPMRHSYNVTSSLIGWVHVLNDPIMSWVMYWWIPLMTSHLWWREWLGVFMQQPVPDSKVHGANMGPSWGWRDPAGSHVGPMKFAVCGVAQDLWCHVASPGHNELITVNSHHHHQMLSQHSVCPADTGLCTGLMAASTPDQFVSPDGCWQSGDGRKRALHPWQGYHGDHFPKSKINVLCWKWCDWV